MRLPALHDAAPAAPHRPLTCLPLPPPGLLTPPPGRVQGRPPDAGADAAGAARLLLCDARRGTQRAVGHPEPCHPRPSPVPLLNLTHSQFACTSPCPLSGAIFCCPPTDPLDCCIISSVKHKCCCRGQGPQAHQGHLRCCCCCCCCCSAGRPAAPSGPRPRPCCLPRPGGGPLDGRPRPRPGGAPPAPPRWYRRRSSPEVQLIYTSWLPSLLLAWASWKLARSGRAPASSRSSAMAVKPLCWATASAVTRRPSRCSVQPGSEARKSTTDSAPAQEWTVEARIGLQRCCHACAFRPPTCAFRSSAPIIITHHARQPGESGTRRSPHP